MESSTSIKPDNAIEPPATGAVDASASDPGPWTHEYSTESSIRRPLKLLANIFSSTIAGRELAWRFFLRNIKGTYRQTLLGFVWILLPLIIQIAAWYYLFTQGNLVAKEVKNFLIFLAIGSVIWQTFFDAILAPMNAMRKNSNTMVRLNFPRETLVLVGLAEVFFNLAVRVVLIGLLCVYYQLIYGGIQFSIYTLMVPVYVIALIFLGTGMGLLISPIGILYQDVGQSLSIISPFWMILTPVVYPAAQSNAVWNAINPPAGLLSASRDLLVTGQTEMHWLAIIWLLIAIPYFLIGLIWYRISFPIVIERMAN